jgi:hypothetical protein
MFHVKHHSAFFGVEVLLELLLELLEPDDEESEDAGADGAGALSFVDSPFFSPLPEPASFFSVLPASAPPDDFL